MVDIRNLDLTGYNVEDLKALAENVKNTLKDKRDEVADNAKKAKAERAEQFNRTTVSKGDTINFLFNKKEKFAYEVKNVNEKSVTVEIDGKKKYIKYENITAVETATATDTETATENVA